MATSTRVKRTEFINRTQGAIGAVKIDRHNNPVGISVEPGDRVFLTDEEVELTDQAPLRAEDSPFKVHEIVHRDPATGDETARFHAPLLEKVEKG